MHTCSTSMSPPSSDQQVWWRDRLDLQHDGVVYMVENFCRRASPTNSREGERKVARQLGLEERCRGEGVTPSESDLCKFEQNSPNPHRNDSKVPTKHFRAGGKRSNDITQQSSMGPTEQIYNSDSKSQEYRYIIQRSKSP